MYYRNIDAVETNYKSIYYKIQLFVTKCLNKKKVYKYL